MKPTRIVLVASLIFVGTDMSVAQTGISENTLDAWVAISDRIVRATIVDVSYEHVNNRPTKGWIRTIVTLKVAETIKGQPTDTLTFGLGGYNVDRHYDGWKEAGTECLWFLGKNSLYGKKENFGEDEIYARYPLQYLYRLRLGPEIAIEKGYEPARPPIFTVTLDVLTEPKSIVEVTKASASYPSERERARALMPPGDLPPESHSLSVPPAIMKRSGRVGIYNYLGMPIDRRLETLARRMVKSPGDLLPKQVDGNGREDAERRFDEAQLRADGAKALRYFKSDENSELLKPLLNDPASTHVTKFVEGKPDETFLEYFVRKEAVATLRTWGVKFEEPVVSVPEPR